MATRDELKSKASQIKNEVEEGRNTAKRVGGLLEDIVDSMAEAVALDRAVEKVNQDLETQSQQVNDKLATTVSHDVSEVITVIL